MKSKIVISLIVSLIIVLSGTSVFAEEDILYFYEDFETLELNKTETYIKNNTNLTGVYNLKTTDYFGGVSLINTANQATTVIGLGNLYEATLYFTLNIDSDAGTTSNRSSVLFMRGDQISSAVGYEYDTSTNQIILYIGGDKPTNGYYDIPTPMTEFNFKVYYNNTTRKMSAWINNELVIENGSITRYTATSFDAIHINNMVNTSYGVPKWSTGIDNIAVTNEYNPFVVDGVCGSSSGGSFANTPSSNLCSSGRLGSFGVQDNGTTYLWACYGSDGGSNDYCSANVSLATAQCGYSNGTVAFTEPYSSHACLSGSITDMTQNDNDSWSWKCQTDSTDFVFCNTVASAPVIPGTLPSNDSISCSISPTDLSTIGDCIGSIFRWAFLPHQDTLNSFYSIPQTLASKSPFGYFYAISDQLKSVSLNSPANVVFSMKSFDNSDVVLLDVNSFKSWAGPEAVDFYFNIIRALLWISFLIWVFNKGRNIFSSNDNEK